MKKKLPKASLPTTCGVPYRETKADIERNRRYAAEDGLRAIQRAEEIKTNKQLMSDIKSLATEQVNNLKKFIK